MARIRSVHPGLFTDEAFASLSMAARVLLVGLWTEADDHGVFEWKPLCLKMRIFPADNVSVPDLLDECLASDLICRFSDGKDYGLIRNFCRYQRPKKPKYVFPMPTELRTYAALNADGSLPVLRQSGTGSENSPQMEDGGGSMEGEYSNSIDSPVVVAATTTTKIEKKSGIAAKRTVHDWEPTEPAIEQCHADRATDAVIDEQIRLFKAYNADRSTPVGELDTKWTLWWARHIERRNAKNAKSTASSSSAAFVPSDRDWDGAIVRWLKNESHWPSWAGNAPGSPSCRAPPDVLRKHGVDPLTGERMRQSA